MHFIYINIKFIKRYVEILIDYFIIYKVSEIVVVLYLIEYRLSTQLILNVQSLYSSAMKA